LRIKENLPPGLAVSGLTVYLLALSRFLNDFGGHNADRRRYQSIETKGQIT
jgi:hypothetical protein